MPKAIAALFLLLTVVVPGAAQARVFLSFGFPFFPFYPAPYYYPPPAYYPPPPAYYPPPYAPAQAAPAAATPSASSGNCKTFKGNATIDSSHQTFYGTACLGADGKWHIQP